MNKLDLALTIANRADAEAMNVTDTVKHFFPGTEAEVVTKAKRIFRRAIDELIEKFAPREAVAVTESKAKRANKPSTPKKAACGRDLFGSKVGSQAAAINAWIGESWISVDDLAVQTEMSKGRVRSHVKHLVKIGAAELTDEGVRAKEGFTFKAKERKAPTFKGERKSKAKYMIENFKAADVIQWMASNGFNLEDVGVAMNTLGCALMSDATININYNMGKKNMLLIEPTTAQIKRWKEATE